MRTRSRSSPGKTSKNSAAREAITYHSSRLGSVAGSEIGMFSGGHFWGLNLPRTDRATRYGGEKRMRLITRSEYLLKSLNEQR